MRKYKLNRYLSSLFLALSLSAGIAQANVLQSATCFYEDGDYKNKYPDPVIMWALTDKGVLSTSMKLLNDPKPDIDYNRHQLNSMTVSGTVHRPHHTRETCILPATWKMKFVKSISKSHTEEVQRWALDTSLHRTLYLLCKIPVAVSEFDPKIEDPVNDVEICASDDDE